MLFEMNRALTQHEVTNKQSCCLKNSQKSKTISKTSGTSFEVSDCMDASIIDIQAFFLFLTCHLKAECHQLFPCLSVAWQGFSLTNLTLILDLGRMGFLAFLYKRQRANFILAKSKFYQVPRGVLLYNLAEGGPFYSSSQRKRLYLRNCHSISILSFCSEILEKYANGWLTALLGILHNKRAT